MKFRLIPIQMIKWAFNSHKNLTAFRVYIFLNLNTDGVVEWNLDKQEWVGKKLSVSTRTVRGHVGSLIKSNWIGRNKSNLYPRSIDTVRLLEGWEDRFALFFYKEWVLQDSKSKGFVYSALVAQLKYRKKKSGELATYGVDAFQNSPDSFISVSNTGFTKYFKVSMSKTKVYKKLSQQHGFIDTKEQHKVKDFPTVLLAKRFLREASNDREYFKRLIRKDRRIIELFPLLIKSNIPLKKRKRIA